MGGRWRSVPGRRAVPPIMKRRRILCHGRGTEVAQIPCGAHGATAPWLRVRAGRGRRTRAPPDRSGTSRRHRPGRGQGRRRQGAATGPPPPPCHRRGTAAGRDGRDRARSSLQACGRTRGRRRARAAPRCRPVLSTVKRFSARYGFHPLRDRVMAARSTTGELPSGQSNNRRSFPSLIESLAVGFMASGHPAPPVRATLGRKRQFTAKVPGQTASDAPYFRLIA